MADTEEEFTKLLKSLNIEIHDKTDYHPDNPKVMRNVKAKKSSLRIEEFASSRDNAERIDNAGVADAMAKIFLSIAGNPVLIQSIGATQLIELLNQIIVTAGLPKEFKLRGKNVNLEAPAEQQAEEMQTMLQKMAAEIRTAIDQSSQATLQAAGEQTAQIVGEAMSGLGQQLTPIAEAVAQGSEVNQIQQQEIQALGQAVAQLSQAVQAVMPPPPPPPPQPTPEIGMPFAPTPDVGVPA